MMGFRPRRVVAGVGLVFGLASCHHQAPPSSAAAPVPVAPPSAPPKVAPVAPPASPPEVTPALIAAGDSLFGARSCQRCHGAKGTAGPNGPDLTTGPWLHGGRSYANLVRIITNGIPRDSLKETTRRFAMNPRGGQPVLTDPEVRAIAAYVWSISAAKK